MKVINFMDIRTEIFQIHQIQTVHPVVSALTPETINSKVNTDLILLNGIALNNPFLSHRIAPPRTTANSSTGLDEYVDILQVQQLLLDSSPSTSTSATTSTSRPRPRLNVQKAAEYSSQVQGTIYMKLTNIIRLLHMTEIILFCKLVKYNKFIDLLYVGHNS